MKYQGKDKPTECLTGQKLARRILGVNVKTDHTGATFPIYFCIAFPYKTCCSSLEHFYNMLRHLGISESSCGRAKYWNHTATYLAINRGFKCSGWEGGGLESPGVAYDYAIGITLKFTPHQYQSHSGQGFVNLKVEVRLTYRIVQ